MWLGQPVPVSREDTCPQQRKGKPYPARSLHEEAFLPVLDLLGKYADVPMSIADACLVRPIEVLPNPLLLTTDSDFKIYRRLGRRVIPTSMP
jgi:hypothetical protein